MAGTPLTHQSLGLQLHKLGDPDADIRFMALNDLYDMVANAAAASIVAEQGASAKIIDGLLKALDDMNGEVQNLAVKGFGPLVADLNPEVWPPAIERLSNLQLENSIDSSIPCTTLKTMVTNLPRPVPGVSNSEQVRRAYDAVSKVLLIRLVGYRIFPSTRKLPAPPAGLLEPNKTKGFDVEALDLLIETVRCFGPVLQYAEVNALNRLVTQINEHHLATSTIKKKAVLASSIIAIYLDNASFDEMMVGLTRRFMEPRLQPATRRALFTLLGSLAHTSSSRLGPYLAGFIPFIFASLTQEGIDKQVEKTAEDGEPDLEQDEVCEAALVTLEACLAKCVASVRPFTNEIIRTITRFTAYDPGYAEGDSDEDMDEDDGEDEMEDDFEDEGFEQENGLSDDEDATWKIRRCAAKALYTLISTRANGDLLEDGTLYERVAPVLVSRFREREENVRLENLAAMTSLIRKTVQGVAPRGSYSQASAQALLIGPSNSRKRRRGGSDVNMIDNDTPGQQFTTSQSPRPVPTGPQASLMGITPSIIKESIKLLKLRSLPTKQSVLILLKTLVGFQPGGLGEQLGKVMGSISDAINGVAGSTGPHIMRGITSATSSSLRLEALELLVTICDAHSTAALAPHLDLLFPGVLGTIPDNYSKTSSSALIALEHLIEVLTPPRLLQPEPKQRDYLEKAFSAITSRTNANDADSEVRAIAIHALGVWLSRTSVDDGETFSSFVQRSDGFKVLKVRLQNEVTRPAAVKAIAAALYSTKSQTDFDTEWVREVVLELSAQLRKSNRSLRVNCLGALKALIINPRGGSNIDFTTSQLLSSNLLHFIDATDLQALTPCLSVLVKLVELLGPRVVTQQMVNGICELAKHPLRGQALEALVLLTINAGRTGNGQALMAGLLNEVGINGEPSIVGRLIGSLLVNGGPKIGVQLEDFEDEIKTATDDHRICLALCVLGESALLQGQMSTLKPEIFTAHFKSRSYRARMAAAVALGRAGAGDLQKYLPVILPGINAAEKSQYLLFHSIKEILQHANSTGATAIHPFLPQIWDNLTRGRNDEDNKSVGAECIGRIALVEPRTYIPALHDQLTDSNDFTRGMIIQAIRYFLTDADESYNDTLRPTIMSSLRAMLSDSVLENRRLALTTLNSAAHNKPDLILPNIGPLLPLVIAETHINKALVREIRMGPFTHVVDDGLEMRKSAYETLYALMGSAFTRINVAELYDRVVAGLDDENDIRALCYLMISKLTRLDPDETCRRLDSLAVHFRDIISFKPKDNAVKQEIEKTDEASKGAFRSTYFLNYFFRTEGTYPIDSQMGWKAYYEWVGKDHANALKAASENFQRVHQD
ncbi:MAG: hypothetical protein M1814_001032 [Vezdaea aestivalis]|nr:MAG: hypothetical protein M1814_001032 [Vezdaea aestivalis]